MIALPALAALEHRASGGGSVLVAGGELEPAKAACVAPEHCDCSPEGQFKRAGWSGFQQSLAAQALSYSAQSTTTLVMFGDSITERLNASSMGQPAECFNDTVAEVRDTIESAWPNLRLHGIAGDQTTQLLWRLQSGGELSPQMAADPLLLSSVLIGINGALVHPAVGPHAPRQAHCCNCWVAQTLFADATSCLRSAKASWPLRAFC